MKYFATITVFAAAISLAACSDDTADKNTTPTVTEKSKMAEAEQAISTVAEKAAAIVEKLKLDTSSLAAFKASLSDMKTSLNADQTNQLSKTLSLLAKDSASEKKNLLSAAKNIASGKSIEETLYETMGDKLDGMTFEDILNLSK